MPPWLADRKVARRTPQEVQEAVQALRATANEVAAEVPDTTRCGATTRPPDTPSSSSSLGLVASRDVVPTIGSSA